LRIFGVTSTVHARLAGLLLEWCKTGKQREIGTQIRFAFTHQEIGECIGTSRESVSRSLRDLKNQYLVRQRGSTLIVPSRSALANYAGIDSMPDDPNEPAAA
jgi:CRP/FNR family transcriptional regulator